MSTTFEIVSPAGITVRTFSCDVMARKFVLKHKADLPGLAIHEVTTTVSRRVVYQPRQARAA